MDEQLLKERKQRLLQLMQDPAYVPMKLKEMAVLLNVPKSRREELKQVLDSLLDDGSIGISKKGKYGKPEIGSLSGLFTGHSKGFGFVTVEGMDQDVFIPPEETGAALHGDKVLITVIRKEPDRRPEGRVIRVLEHANREIVGYYQKNKGFGFVIPDNQKISCDFFIPQEKDMGAVQGHKVVMRVTSYGGGTQGNDGRSHINRNDRRGSERSGGRHGSKPEGVITEILGHVNDPGTDILSIIRAYGLPETFPEDVMRQVSHVPEQISEEEKHGRLDLRQEQTVTIDGEDAKDLDDAITISVKDDIFTLGVHIADVAHYVREGGFLDLEARKRGTSVYLVDRVIPMLPHKLSNGICSLNQGEDRLALSCIMDVDREGRVLGHRIAETVIRVDRRMSYTAVNAIVTQKDESAMREYQELVPMFQRMKELSDVIRAKRKKRGSIDFDFPESKIVLDGNGKPVDIKPYERNTATRIIEDFMLLANETVAEDFFWQEIPFLYRTHDNPDPDKMKGLGTFINNFGYAIRLNQGEVRPGEVQRLLDKIEGTPEEALISRLTLRSMKQAKYTTVCSGHFGLAAKYYTHFTSPIRRYPDLQIHRIIKENLQGGLNEKRMGHYEHLLPEVAVSSSALERRADEAERETDKLKKCEYMSERIGQEFDGVISGVTNWGLYVELPNTVEGLIRMQDLRDDYYIFDESQLELVGEMSGKRYKLGQKIRIAVSGTDRLSRTIDFALSETEPIET